MRIVEHYSHLNGLEYLLVHKPVLWEELQQVITSVDAARFKTKISREKTMPGKLLYAPKEMNRSLNKSLTERG